MNIRKIKKKKNQVEPKDPQSLAKDKLFQLSWFCEEKEEDASQVLIENSRSPDPKPTLFRSPKKKYPAKGYRSQQKCKTLGLQDYRSINQHSCDYSPIKQNKFEQFNTTICGIYNTVPSRKVFVGKLQASESQRKSCPQAIEEVISNARYRTVTMPAITENVKNRVSQIGGYTLRSTVREKLLTMYRQKPRGVEQMVVRRRIKEQGKSLNAYIHNLSSYLHQTKKFVYK